MTSIDNIINKNNTVELLKNLIEIYSPYFEEEEITKYVHDWMREKNIPVKYHYFEDNKITKYKGINVIGELKGSKPGPKVLINGHLDTVGICEGWQNDPMKAYEKDGKLYGLGSLDMKSGSVAAMLAIEAFNKTVSDFNGSIIYTFVSGEEGPYGLGTNYLIHDGLLDNVDVAIVPEPSSGFTGKDFPCLCLGARGGYSYTVEFKGKSAHAANPQKGICAIEDASKVIIKLKKANLKEDPCLGKGDICIIDISGGGAACSVADKASFTVFRHIVNGENKDTIIKEVEEAVKAAGINSEYKIIFREGPTPDSDGFLPYTVDINNQFTEKFIKSIKNITDKDPNIAYFGSIGDFNYIGSRTKIPTFVFGPGGSNYHAPDEFVYIDDIIQTSKIIYDFLVRLLK